MIEDAKRASYQLVQTFRAYDRAQLHLAYRDGELDWAVVVTQRGDERCQREPAAEELALVQHLVAGMDVGGEHVLLTCQGAKLTVRSYQVGYEQAYDLDWFPIPFHVAQILQRWQELGVESVLATHWQGTTQWALDLGTIRQVGVDALAQVEEVLVQAARLVNPRPEELVVEVELDLPDVLHCTLKKVVTETLAVLPEQGELEELVRLLQAASAKLDPRATSSVREIDGRVAYVQCWFERVGCALLVLKEE